MFPLNAYALFPSFDQFVDPFLLRIVEEVLRPVFDSTGSGKGENSLNQDLENMVDGAELSIRILGVGLWPLVHHGVWCCRAAILTRCSWSIFFQLSPNALHHSGPIKCKSWSSLGGGPACFSGVAFLLEPPVLLRVWNGVRRSSKFASKNQPSLVLDNGG